MRRQQFHNERPELTPDQYSFEDIGSRNKFKMVRKAYHLQDEDILLIIFANPTNNQCLAAEFKLDRQRTTFENLDISNLIFMFVYDANQHILVPTVDATEKRLKKGLLYLTRDIISQALQDNRTIPSESDHIKLKNRRPSND